MTRSHPSHLSRRDWLRMFGGAAGLAALGGVGTLAAPREVQAGDYRALVCIFRWEASGQARPG